TDGSGNYAFATDIRGRVVFDLNILALPDALWLDIDLTAVEAALTHLNRYVVVEDVGIADASAEWAGLGCCGPKAAGVARGLGAANLAGLAPLTHLPLEDGRMRLVRHDIAGMTGFELIVAREAACAAWDRI